MKKRWIIGGALAAGIATAAACASSLQTNKLVVRLFGPGAVDMAENYEGTGNGATFDHGPFTVLLAEHVHGHRVDYAGLQQDEPALDAYITSIADADFDGLNRDAKLALLINAYNAFTLKLILEHYPLASIKDIPAADRWDAVRWDFAGRTLSLTQIEHEELRRNFVEPRIHFAINCASIGCPPLRAEAYEPWMIAAQLREQTQLMHDDPLWVELDGSTANLTALYLWYEADFSAVSGSSLLFASQYRPELASGDWRVQFKDYDWGLNDVPAAQ